MADPENIPGQRYFRYIDLAEVPEELMFKPKEKFPKKYCVWQAIDEDGNVSEPYIKVGTLKSDEYREECLKKRLLPFIEEHHHKSDIMFWPDLATIHYESSVQTLLANNGIDCVTRKANAPNVPQARPIERFWALCKKKHSEKTVPAKKHPRVSPNLVTN